MHQILSWLTGDEYFSSYGRTSDLTSEPTMRGLRHIWPDYYVNLVLTGI